MFSRIACPVKREEMIVMGVPPRKTRQVLTIKNNYKQMT